MTGKKKQFKQPDRIMKSCGLCHYGFIVLAIATLGKVFSSPGQSPCIGVIIEDVRLDVNITRSALTGYYFAATTTSALFLPLGGRLIDHFGPRIMVGVFASGLGLACFVISWVQKPGGFHLFLALVGFESVPLTSNLVKHIEDRMYSNFFSFFVIPFIIFFILVVHHFFLVYVAFFWSRQYDECVDL